MRFFIYIVSILTLSFSCSESKKRKTRSTELEQAKTDVLKEHLDFTKETNITLNDWVNYYHKASPSFSLNKFEFKSTDPLNILPGNVDGIFEPGFEMVYSNFLVYQKNREKYIDFDSYSWTLNEKGELLISPDQEINMVDIKNKKVDRIAFRGPSQWVENVFWKDHTTVVLLENNYHKQPLITIIDLAKKSITTFMYPSQLDIESKYSKKRFQKLGFKYE